MAPRNSNGAELTMRIQSLPTELVDLIKDFTFAQKSLTTIYIDASWRPPPTLQVNRKLRQAGSVDYYGSDTFNIEIKTVCKWLKAHTLAQIEFIGHIKLHFYRACTKDAKPLDCRRLWTALRDDASNAELQNIVLCTWREKEVLLRRYQEVHEFFEIKKVLPYDVQRYVFDITYTPLCYITPDSKDVQTIWMSLGTFALYDVMDAMVEEYRKRHPSGV